MPLLGKYQTEQKRRNHVNFNLSCLADLLNFAFDPLREAKDNATEITTRNNNYNATMPRASTQPENSQADKPLFFYMPDAEWGEFCQWHESSFTVSKAEISDLVGRTVNETNPDETISFNCAEQFMMYCKAARFHDVSTQDLILATSSPKEQKRLGKNVSGFTNESWDQIKSTVASMGNKAKFGQNAHLGRKLLSTGDRLLCEAASKDRVWGIGYTAKHAMSHRQHWGENRLGKALMVTREHLRSEEARNKKPWEQYEA